MNTIIKIFLTVFFFNLVIGFVQVVYENPTNVESTLLSGDKDITNEWFTYYGDDEQFAGVPSPDQQLTDSSYGSNPRWGSFVFDTFIKGLVPFVTPTGQMSSLEQTIYFFLDMFRTIYMGALVIYLGLLLYNKWSGA